ncbi:MAG: phenylalanine--tRNA ligase subunit beta, partial [Rhodospirillaceae bacterium]|nr:phenylalanine--tRNA ligase subunit beta [Rhodospirillaceae bacterium]
MKFTLSWLKDHLETTASLEEITKRLTMLGLEVEGVHDRAKGLENFVVAEVVAAEKHPDADKLQICTVNTGSETLQVVCGAPNARAGMKGVFGGVGEYVPGIDVTLKQAKIRGVESNGMLLSMREMGLSDEHEGIVDLPVDAKIGARAVDAMGLDDVVIEIAITPNRGDCLGVRGIARDLAASGLGHLKALSTDPVPGSFKSPISVSISDKTACPQFVGRMVRGVTNQQSPKWMRERLLAIGLRPISALVDITNYVMFDLGRPLHVFDGDKVKGNITAGLAKGGEKFLALDGKEYVLDNEICIIADDNGPDALGGVMGGEISGCTEETTSVFIESAIFDPIRTAATGRKLNIISDARFRFERS